MATPNPQAAVDEELVEVEFEECGLTILSKAMPSGQWLAIGQQLSLTEKGYQWWIGDWVLYGEKTYGEDDAIQAIDPDEWKVDTVLQYRWVAERVEPVRRNGRLTWSHHREIADLQPAKQSKWLTLAAEEGWTVERLRRELKQTKAKAEGREVGLTYWVMVEARDADDQEAFHARMIGEGRQARKVEKGKAAAAEAA